MPEPKYKRILLKLGGEALAGVGGYGIEPQMVANVAQQIAAVKRLGV